MSKEARRQRLPLVFVLENLNGISPFSKVQGDPLDDVADDARYGIYTFITSTEKPQDLAVRDEMRALAEQGDLTSAAIRYLQMTEESQRSYQPATLGRRR